MKSPPSANMPPLGMSPENPDPFFSAEVVGGGTYQEHLIFRQNQKDAWMRMYTKQMQQKRVTKADVKAIEPAARLILRIFETQFESKLFINTDLVSRQEAETLIELVGDAFQAPLNRDGTLLVYYTETPYRYDWN
jgi:hypothetical protein